MAEKDETHFVNYSENKLAKLQSSPEKEQSQDIRSTSAPPIFQGSLFLQIKPKPNPFPKGTCSWNDYDNHDFEKKNANLNSDLNEDSDDEKSSKYSSYDEDEIQKIINSPKCSNHASNNEFDKLEITAELNSALDNPAHPEQIFGEEGNPKPSTPILSAIKSTKVFESPKNLEEKGEEIEETSNKGSGGSTSSEYKVNSDDSSLNSAQSELINNKESSEACNLKNLGENGNPAPKQIILQNSNGVNPQINAVNGSGMSQILNGSNGQEVGLPDLNKIFKRMPSENGIQTSPKPISKYSPIVNATMTSQTLLNQIKPPLLISNRCSLPIQNFEHEEIDQKKLKKALKLARDQAGCRMLQKWLDKNDPILIKDIFDQIIGEFSDLMMDPFGNYLCHKVSEASNNEQLFTILNKISEDLIKICTNQHGTRAAQKLFEVIKNESALRILTESLKRDVVGLVKDNNGNHVIQKCLFNLSYENKQFIFDAIKLNCFEVATHKHGCCVIQRCLDYGNKNQKEDLVEMIVVNTLNLVKDQYGNYVVQYVLEMTDMQIFKMKIADMLVNSIVDLSMQKFSSNVIEKCLRLDLTSFQEKVIDAVSNESILPKMLMHKYANYVIQSCLSISKGRQKEKLIKIVQKNLGQIKHDEFGNKILQKITKSYPDLDLDNDDSPTEEKNSGVGVSTNHQPAFPPPFGRSQSHQGYSNPSPSNSFHSMGQNSMNHFIKNNLNNNFNGNYQGPPIPSKFLNSQSSLSFNQIPMVPPPINLQNYGNYNKGSSYQNWGLNAFSNLNPVNYHANYNKREGNPMIPLKFEKI